MTGTDSNTPWGTSAWTWAAWAVSLSALAGSLLLSMAVGLKACPLCLYQRTFIMGLVGVLGVGVCLGGWRPGAVSLLALPLAVGSLGIVIFHEGLRLSGKLECPLGLTQFLTAPQESLAVHLLLTGLLVVDIVRARMQGGASLVGAGGAVLLGVLFTFGAIQSSPQACRPDYSIPLNQDGCRKPQR